ncbi:branched-chain amino acid ABC transporter permease [Sporosarcina newyorkensis]|uniref:Branched-chain amino acid transport system permease protein n=2 Tax=Sporosarcina newyorkensis TaxID=759851 RepID=A0A1T4Y134_9BACL|nr:branched-chain amino acid ABC transporter permease [Sporosarcina newyorkensis]EGQ26892.1 branched chain amino acid ABC superfamily ATP binding cassette transporter, membrane protein [Sporosarcina newyorkensis 2681]SKA95198.1 branched-chain amino acid transport system permease protein [Sporosarcina newyorkensis]
MEHIRKLGYRKLMLLIGVIALLMIPLGITNPYFMYVINLILIYILLVLGLDLIVGYTGQVSLGHGAFFGLGAYIAAVFSTNFGISFWLTLPMAIIATGAIGFVIGFIGLKLIEEYLVMATLAFGTIIWLVFLNWTNLTGGPMGIALIPPPPPMNFGIFELSFTQYADYYPLFLFFVIVAIGITKLLINSGFGRACTAIRDDELAAQSMGIPVFRTKVVMFTISAAYCGAAGTLYAHFIHVVSPETFNFTMSVTILTMVMIGGQGSIIGAVLGASLLTVFSEALRAAPELRMLIYGLLIVIMMMFFPRGIMGIIHMFRQRLEKRSLGKRTKGGNDPVDVKKEGLGYE